MPPNDVRLPKWLERRYTFLWESFGDSGFGFEDAVKVLGEKNRDRKEDVLVFLSELRKAGWLQTEFAPEDARKRVYRLKSKAAKISELFSIGSGPLGRNEVEGLLKKAADLIRTRVDYKFILILLFLKRISDKWEVEFEEAYRDALADGFSEEEARREARSEAYHSFNLPEEFLWDNIRKDVSGLPERVSRGSYIVFRRTF